MKFGRVPRNAITCWITSGTISSSSSTTTSAKMTVTMVVATVREVPIASSRSHTGSSRYAIAMPATNGSRMLFSSTSSTTKTTRAMPQTLAWVPSVMRLLRHGGLVRHRWSRSRHGRLIHLGRQRRRWRRLADAGVGILPQRALVRIAERGGEQEVLLRQRALELRHVAEEADVEDRQRARQADHPHRLQRRHAAQLLLDVDPLLERADRHLDGHGRLFAGVDQVGLLPLALDPGDGAVGALRQRLVDGRRIARDAVGEALRRFAAVACGGDREILPA